MVLRLKPINDQRKLYVSLTQEGQTLYSHAQAQVEEAYRQIEAQFTAEKMQQLTVLLEEFITGKAVMKRVGSVRAVSRRYLSGIDPLNNSSRSTCNLKYGEQKSKQCIQLCQYVVLVISQ